GLLFSVGKGLFFFSPPLVLSLFAFGSFFRADWKLATGVCILLLATLIFHAQWINWAGGWCWGPRHIFAIHVFLALPIAFWVKERYGPVCRICLTVFLTIGIAVQLLGCSQSFMDYYDRLFRWLDRDARLDYFALYEPQEEAWISQNYTLMLNENGQPTYPISIRALQAPIQDSIYVPQHSVWNGYARLWKAGYRDNLWWRLIWGENVVNSLPEDE
ncbi:MAG: hypothetical protein V2A74_04925, partial [bacterium]